MMPTRASFDRMRAMTSVSGVLTSELLAANPKRSVYHRRPAPSPRALRRGLEKSPFHHQAQFPIVLHSEVARHEHAADEGLQQHAWLIVRHTDYLSRGRGSRES